VSAGFSRTHVLIAAVLLGLATVTIVYMYFFRPSSGSGARVPVVVAADFIPADTVISANMIKVELLPQSDVEVGAFSNVSQVSDRVSVTPFQVGEQVVAERLTDRASAFGLPGIIPPGRRAMTISVDSADAVSGLLQPGNRVDVVASYTEGSDSIARTIIQDVLLLAVNARLKPQSSEEASADAQKAKPGAASTSTSVTIAVTPDEAERLVAAQYKGKLKLGLRGPDDGSRFATGGARMSSILGLPQPTPPSYGVPPPPSPTATASAVKKRLVRRHYPKLPPMAVAPVEPGLPGGAGAGTFGAPGFGKTIRVIKGTKVEEVAVEN